MVGKKPCPPYKKYFAFEWWAKKLPTLQKTRLFMRRLKHFWLEMRAEYGFRRVGWATLHLPTDLVNRGYAFRNDTST